MKYLIIILTAVLIFPSCEKYIDIDIAEKERKTVINSLFSTDSLFKISITQSALITEPTNYNTIDNATIELYENGILSEKITGGINGLYQSDDFYIKHGNNYEIFVKQTGIETVNAISSTPKVVDITSATYEETYINYNYIDCRVSFTDPPNEKNYYMLNLKTYEVFDDGTIVGYTAGDYTYYERWDPIFEEWADLDGMSRIFSDELIDGKRYDLSLLIGQGNILHNGKQKGKGYVEFYLNAISKEMYDYIITYKKYAEAKETPMIEPAKVYSNINGGLGIFAGYSRSKYVMEVEWK